MDFAQIGIMILNGILTLVISWAGYKLNKYRKAEEQKTEEKEKHEKARDALNLSVARSMLMRECNHYIRKGYAPIYAVQSTEEMYNAYHDFGGNGAITSLMEDFRALPHYPKRDLSEMMDEEDETNFSTEQPDFLKKRERR